MHIVAWGNVAPWAEQRQVEQDLVISRTLVELFNDWDTDTYDKPRLMTYRVDNPWFTGQADIPTYSREELLATKLRALMQRQKGRDLFDLAHAIAVFDGLDTLRLVDIFRRYMAAQELSLSRAQAEQRMFAKLADPGLVADIRPLLAAPEAERLTDKAINGAFARVFTDLIGRLPGRRWARTNEMIERFGLRLVSTD